MEADKKENMKIKPDQYLDQNFHLQMIRIK